LNQKWKKKKIEELGKITFINIPNRYHRLDAGVYKNRYKDAKVICPTRSKVKIEEKCKVDVVDEDPGIYNGTGIKVLNIVGVKAENVFELDISEGSTINEKGDKALVFCDLIINHFPIKNKFKRFIWSSPPGELPFISPIYKFVLKFFFSDYTGFKTDMAKKMRDYGDSLKVACFAHDYHLVTHEDKKPATILKELFTASTHSVPVNQIPPYVEAVYKPINESLKYKKKMIKS